MTVRTQPGQPLTGRESEVADLIASGLTNRQIAIRLSLSVRTVEAHLRTIYRKTQTGTRTRLALWRVRQEQTAIL